MRESDWAALADVQFILYNRIANQLNEALSGIALSDMPEAQDKPPGYWKERATNKIINVLNLFTAWTWLIRFKSGEPIPERAIRPFDTNAILGWLGRQLQLSPPPTTKMNPLLHGNQETLQEALLLLYSVAYTQGSSIRLAFEATKLGTWFRVRFDRSKAIPSDLDALLASFGDHWRDQDARFELTTARDFASLNGCKLTLTATPTGGEFSFFVRAASAARPQKVADTASTLASATAKPDDRAASLDPESVARYLDQRAETEQSGSDLSATPVIRKESLEKASAKQASTGPQPPSLAVLRPLPPQLMPSTASPPVAVPRKLAESAEQVIPEKPATDTKPGTIIRPANIPKPTLPERLRKPPAATSNVALTRDTQTMTPVTRPDKTAPAATDKPSSESSTGASNETTGNAVPSDQHAPASKNKENA